MARRVTTQSVPHAAFFDIFLNVGDEARRAEALAEAGDESLIKELLPRPSQTEMGSATVSVAAFGVPAVPKFDEGRLPNASGNATADNPFAKAGKGRQG